MGQVGSKNNFLMQLFCELSGEEGTYLDPGSEERITLKQYFN